MKHKKNNAILFGLSESRISIWFFFNIRLFTTPAAATVFMDSSHHIETHVDTHFNHTSWVIYWGGQKVIQVQN